MQQNLFQRDEVAGLMVATFQKYRDAGEYELHEYVVMPNHVHLLLSLKHQNLGRIIQFIKGGFSHALHQHGSAVGTVWQQRYYDRRIRDENEFAEIAKYIRQNPVRKGLVENAADYPFSSARVSGLKPLQTNKEGVDATLKGGSTSQCAEDATLKVSSISGCGPDPSPTARSNSESDTKCIAIS